jgi:hypothetical protein
MKSTLGIGLLILMAACAGTHKATNGQAYAVAHGGLPTTTTDFYVRVEQTSAPPMAIPRSESDPRTATPIDVKYAVAITNKTKDAVTVRHVTLSCRDRYFMIPRSTRNFNKAIAPGATEKMDFWVSANAPGAEVTIITPGSIGAVIEFEGPQGTRTESFLCPVLKRKT